MANTKLDRIERDIEKTRAKILEQQKTGHVAYSVLPVIAEVATETKIRPERPMAIAVIASQQAITASPISAATVAMLSMLSGYHISLMNILMISVPCTLLGVLAGAIYSLRVGKELDQDPE